MSITADPIFYKRFSPRKFKDLEIEEEHLAKLFDAARWAASSYNEQPWRFIYAKKGGDEIYPKLLSCLNEFNQKWAQGAPVLMLTIAKRDFERDGSPNRHAMHDVGMAMGNLATQAAKLDIMVHQMAGFDNALARRQFHLREEFEPVAMVAMGYTDESKSDRKRKRVEEIAFTNISDIKELQ